MGDYDGNDENTDQAFVMRLPQHVAEKVRAMIRANDFSGLELKVDREHSVKGFKGRTGCLTVGSGTSEAMQLPATFMDLPTLVEAYRTIDGKSGDYVKCGDVQQICMVHETEQEGQQVRASRPSGRYHSGITPPTYKITREFAKFKPHYSHLLKNRKIIPKNALRRAENHICRISKKSDKGQEGGGGDDDTEIEEIEVECDSPRAGQQEEQEEVGGGLPYRGQDGVMYYAKNSRAYLHSTNQRVGFLATKVVFKQLVRGYGVIVVAKCDMPRKMRVQDNQRPTTGTGEEVDEEELDAEIQGEKVKEIEDMLDDAELEGEEGADEAPAAAVVAAAPSGVQMDSQLAHELGDEDASQMPPSQRDVLSHDFADAARSPNQPGGDGGVDDQLQMDMSGDGEVVEGQGIDDSGLANFSQAPFSDGMQPGAMGTPDNDNLQLARSPPLPKSPAALPDVNTPGDGGMGMPPMAMPEGMGMGEMPTDDGDAMGTEWQQYEEEATAMEGAGQEGVPPSEVVPPEVVPPTEVVPPADEGGEGAAAGEEVEMGVGAEGAVWEEAVGEGGVAPAVEGEAAEGDAAVEEAEGGAPGLSEEDREEAERQLATLTAQLAPLEEAVQAKEKALASAPNPLLKRRIQSQLDPLVAQRDGKLAEVTELKARLRLL